MDKKHKFNKGLIHDIIEDIKDDPLNLLIPATYAVGKTFEIFKHYSVQKNDGQLEIISKKLDKWGKFLKNLKNYPVSERIAIMFLSDDSAFKIFRKKYPEDLDIVYIPSSLEIPAGIKIHGIPSKGVLYVLDPRDNITYFPAEEISKVLLTDHLLEMESIYARLGAKKIEISFVQEVDDKNVTGHSEVQKAKASNGIHSGDVSHEHSGQSQSIKAKYHNLEINEELQAKKTEINWEKYYWHKVDNIFKREIDNISDGLTKEFTIREISKSYLSQTSMDLHKIEAEYSYLKSIKVSGEVSWSKESLSELSKSTIWNVHVEIDD